MKVCKKIMVVLLCALMLLPLSGFVRAETPLSLTIVYDDYGTPVVGAAFDIYLLATMDRKGDLTVAEPFDQYPVKIEYTDDETWGLLASTLQGYILRDNLPATDGGVTDDTGELCLPSQGKTLQRGVYLVIGHFHEQNHYTYESTPCIAILPHVDEITHKWVYDAELRPKFSKAESGAYAPRRVMKFWEDDGYDALRPVEITVDLLRNGEVYETVVLSKENGWKHIWDDLPLDSHWMVVEREMENYTVAVTREDVTFFMTNTWAGDEPPPPTEPPDPSTPDSGQLWWPVPVLSCGGMVLVILGLIRRRGSEDEE